MGRQFADNSVAIEYQRLEAEIDWCKASDQEELTQMLRMHEMLLKANGGTVVRVWDSWCSKTGERVVETVAELLDYLRRRISRYEQYVKKAA